MKKDKKLKVSEEWCIGDNQYKCPECGKVYSRMGISSHIFRSHTEEGRALKSNFIEYNKNHEVWNKGLTKETDERVRRGAKNTSIALKGRPGRKISDDEKKRISKSLSRYYKENPRFHSMRNKESYPERLFREVIESMSVGDKFIQFYSCTDFEKAYEMDFAIPDLKVYFEINGGQHYNDDYSLNDYHIKRKEYIESYGWKQIDVYHKICHNKENVKRIVILALSGKIDECISLCDSLFYEILVEKGIMRL